jgi:hypothetical protein
VNAGQDDLGNAFFAEAAHRVGDVFARRAALGAAQERDDAERAPPSAAVLNLEKRARAARVEKRGGRLGPHGHREECGLARLVRPHDLAREKAGVVCVEERREAAPGAEGDDEVDLAHPGECVGVCLGEAARDDERRSGILAAQPAHETPAVAERAIRDCAAVDEEDVRVGGDVRARERRRRPTGLDAAHLAAEGLRVHAADAGIR